MMVIEGRVRMVVVMEEGCQIGFIPDGLPGVPRDVLVEFGVKKLCGNDKHGQPRYSYTYADVTYITDSTSTKGTTGLHINCCWIVAERVFHMFHIDNVNMRRGEETIVLKSTILVTDEHNSTHFSSPSPPE